MNQTINSLDSSGNAEKLPDNLQKPISNMLTDYTPDTHETLGLHNSKYGNITDKVWEEDGSVNMAVPKEQLVKVMRGVADDPEAFAQMYRAEKQYSQDVFAGMPDDADSYSTHNRIRETTAALGAFDGVRADIVFDERFDKIQWTNDFNHAVTAVPGAALNFVPTKYIATGDIANRILDFSSYEATKDRVAEATQEATEKNSDQFDAGQRESDAMIVEWARSNGHKADSDFTEYLISDGQTKHKEGRDTALDYLISDR
ncbi:hypothetical protein [Streptomyces sp. H27-D2]|uniref:hypothetical protein n=1 Tax=Streptomyces sp. H27-D2 TaxID=3046304 RepID=UPI002DBDB12B|nr:hypothetical protein [Streptomyces sp. H27-D2]MEC4019180.1 hypothetical protein [Streptomyces sp. H27-D2]